MKGLRHQLSSEAIAEANCMRLGGFRVEVMRPSAWGSRFRGLFAHVYAVFKVWDLARLLKGSWDLVARGFRVATLIVT